MPKFVEDTVMFEHEMVVAEMAFIAVPEPRAP
jgi:hypothetical protein